MAGLVPKVQAGAWHLISVNVNRQCSSDMSVIAEKLLEPVRMRAHMPVIFSVQETRSWDVPYLEFRNSFAKLRGRGGSKRDEQQGSLKPLW